MKKILVVEDQYLNADLLVQLLENKYEVFVEKDGVTGIEAARRERPDLILIDLHLPEVDGWEATRRLKASDDLKHIPIIAVTAHTMPGDKEKALACGCDDYMAKPLDEDLLFKKLEQFLFIPG